MASSGMPVKREAARPKFSNDTFVSEARKPAH
jgi:hypothetical protein